MFVSTQRSSLLRSELRNPLAIPGGLSVRDKLIPQRSDVFGGGKSVFLATPKLSVTPGQDQKAPC